MHAQAWQELLAAIFIGSIPLLMLSLRCSIENGVGNWIQELGVQGKLM